MVEFVTRMVALPPKYACASVPVVLWAIVHVSTTISTGRVCVLLYAVTPVLLLTNTDFRMLTLAVPDWAETARMLLYSNRLFSITIFEFVSLPVKFTTPMTLLRISLLFTIRFDPTAAWVMPEFTKP